MNDKDIWHNEGVWYIKDKEDKQTQKYIEELNLWINVLCGEEGPFTLYKVIATSYIGYAIMLPKDSESNYYYCLNLKENEIVEKDKPCDMSFEEFFSKEYNVSNFCRPY